MADTHCWCCQAQVVHLLLQCTQQALVRRWLIPTALTQHCHNLLRTHKQSMARRGQDTGALALSVLAGNDHCWLPCCCIAVLPGAQSVGLLGMLTSTICTSSNCLDQLHTQRHTFATSAEQSKRTQGSDSCWLSSRSTSEASREAGCAAKMFAVDISAVYSSACTFTHAGLGCCCSAVSSLLSQSILGDYIT